MMCATSTDEHSIDAIKSVALLHAPEEFQIGLCFHECTSKSASVAREKQSSGTKEEEMLWERVARNRGCPPALVEQLSRKGFDPFVLGKDERGRIEDGAGGQQPKGKRNAHKGEEEKKQQELKTEETPLGKGNREMYRADGDIVDAPASPPPPARRLLRPPPLPTPLLSSRASYDVQALECLLHSLQTCRPSSHGHENGHGDGHEEHSQRHGHEDDGERSRSGCGESCSELKKRARVSFSTVEECLFSPALPASPPSAPACSPPRALGASEFSPKPRPRRRVCDGSATTRAGQAAEQRRGPRRDKAVLMRGRHDALLLGLLVLVFLLASVSSLLLHALG